MSTNTPANVFGDDDAQGPTTQELYEAALEAKQNNSTEPSYPGYGAAHGILAEYLDDAQLAHELNVSPRTVARWRAMREGPPVTRVGRRVMYRRSAVEAWLVELERCQVAS